LEETSFGRYRLMTLLGRGGMGEVWRARDTETDRIVAVKVLPAQLAHDDMFKQRFRREAHAAAQLTEPHVVPIHSYGEIDGRLYVDMRLIEGRDLQAILGEGPLDPGRAVTIVDQVAKALQAAHNVGLVHRDVKPSNVLVAEYDFAYLIDFGIARGVDQTGLTNTGSMIGTWAYMAPERFGSGSADARADIYALACVLHECLTGSKPFPGNSLEQQVTAHLTAPPPRPSVARRGVPQTFDNVIAKGMAKDPDQRYRTTLELADAARSAATSPIPRPPPPPPPEPPTQRAAFAGGQGQPPPSTPGQVTPDQPAEPGPPSHRRRLAVIGALLAVVVLAVVTGVVLWVTREKPAGPPEIFLEPATAAGQNPFTPSAAVPQPKATNPGADPAGAPVPGGGVRTANGELPGLYGGSRNLTTCDTAVMVTYLAQNPDKGRAWASVFNITPEQIPSFVAELTPVLLRTDTRVTNHGFENGQATSLQSVLQAGTAVLVDKFGVPRVRCACGNPLLEPVAVTSEVYSDQRWATFSPQSLSTVRPSPTAIDTFILYDPVTGTFFGRPRGGNGTNDVNDPRAAPPPPPPATETPPPPPPVTQAPVYPQPQYTPPYTPPPTTYTPPPTSYTPPPTSNPPPTTIFRRPTTAAPPS
jgi:predicted Ser/Thr protein kinase